MHCQRAQPISTRKTASLTRKSKMANRFGDKTADDASQGQSRFGDTPADSPDKVGALHSFWNGLYDRINPHLIDAFNEAAKDHFAGVLKDAALNAATAGGYGAAQKLNALV